MIDAAASSGRCPGRHPCGCRRVRGAAASLGALALLLIASACDRPAPGVSGGAAAAPVAATEPATPDAPESPAGSPPASAPPEQAPGPHPSGLPFHTWRRLDLSVEEATLLSGSVELRRREGSYRPPEGGPGRPALLVESRTKAQALLFLDIELGSTSEIDPETGATREYLEVTPGEKAKLLRVEPDLLRMIRYRASKGSDAPLRRWETHGKERWQRPAGDGGAVPLYDYYALIAHLGDLPLRGPGDRATVWMATSSGPLELEVRVLEQRNRQRTLRDLKADRDRTVGLRELRLGLAPLRGEGEKVRGFLRMEGETELWVEAESGTVLEIRGRIPRIGMISVVLTGLR